MDPQIYLTLNAEQSAPSVPQAVVDCHGLSPWVIAKMKHWVAPSANSMSTRRTLFVGIQVETKSELLTGRFNADWADKYFIYSCLPPFLADC